jgi:hypothetical protein
MKMTELETKTEKELSRRKFLGKLGLGIAGIALAGLSGCGERVSEENPERITLKVGSGYTNGLRYAGMPNKETFSLASSNSRSSVNNYYPAEAENICFLNSEYKVIEVNPKYITLDKIAESCKVIK